MYLYKLEKCDTYVTLFQPQLYDTLQYLKTNTFRSILLYKNDTSESEPHDRNLRKRYLHCIADITVSYFTKQTQDRFSELKVAITSRTINISISL